MNSGIDYGLGQTNIDKETGIRFGVIGQNSASLNPDAAQEVWEHGKNLSFENYQDQVKKELRSALSDYFSDFKGIRDVSQLDEAVRNCFEVIEDDLSQNYDSGDDTYLYEEDGYKIQNDETDLWVIKSPYYTYAQFCSPCAPGACHLGNAFAIEDIEGTLGMASDLKEKHANNRCYCLGHDWFENNKAPYPVYKVETGELVLINI